MSKSAFVKSTILLTIATFISKALGSIFRIPLQNIAGDTVLGIFSLVYPVYMVSLTLSVAGIPIAISKLIADARAKNNFTYIKEIYMTASILALLFGISSFILIYIFSTPISNALGGTSIKPALLVVTATLLIAPYMAVYRGYFQGFGDMRPTAISQVIEQLVRVGLILITAFYFVQKEASDETIGGWIMTGSVAGAFISLFYLKIRYKRFNLNHSSNRKYTLLLFSKWSKKILKLSIPIAIGAITMALINFIDSFTIPYGLRSIGVSEKNINYLYGIYGRGLSIVQIATVFSTSIVLPLIPLLTKKVAQGDRDGAQNIIEKTQRVTHIISWPAALGLFSLTLPINIALFTDLQGSWVLAIIGFSSVFTSLTILSTGILQGMNLAKLAATIIIFGVLIKSIANIYFIQLFGLTGAALSTLIVYLCLFLINSFFIYKNQPFSFMKLTVVKIICSSIIMGLVIALPFLYINIENWSRLQALLYLIFAILAGAGLYTLQLLIFKVVDSSIIKETIKSIFKMAHKPAGKDNKNMFKRKWIWMILTVLLVITLPKTMERINVESENNTYEIVVPYEEVEKLAIEDERLTIDSILTSLKKAGLNSVSITPISLNWMEDQSIINIFSEQELASALLFSEQKGAINVKQQGYYITPPQDPYFKNLIEKLLQPATISIKNQNFYFLKKEEDILSHNFAYNQKIIDKVHEYDLNPIFRIENSTKPLNQIVINQLINVKNKYNANILFSGQEVIGYPNINNLKKWTNQLSKVGYHFYAIEFSLQRGIQTVARQTNYDMIRLHSINLNNKTMEQNIDQAARAVKERKIRSIFFRFEDGDAIASIESAKHFIKNVHTKLSPNYHSGSPSTFKEINIPKWTQIVILISGILFTGLEVSTLRSRMLVIAASIFMTCLAILYLVSQKLLLLQGFALIIGIVAPIFSILSTMTLQRTTIRYISLQYLKALSITFVGILIVIGLLNGNEFITGFEIFRGVKLVYIVPIVFISVYLLWREGLKLLNQSVKYWHLALLSLIGIVGLYYITRTGNNAAVSSIELMVRSSLEELLYVRPRTKEFLIGFPLYLLAIYVINFKSLLGKLLLIPGVIGFLSIMNTFTHIHIPLHISLLRSAYSIIIGYVIGLLFIFLYKKCAPVVEKWISKRWA
ncbi:DUF5693 family protein [Virgibacillus proomii]|uniref:DUF5693 family protein n=1 Tax=Virgibacillus proomii TaxID=84407 RepID=UPI000987C6C4|nr:DUF5693 family protein [Virgibacillus proomii]